MKIVCAGCTNPSIEVTASSSLDEIADKSGYEAFWDTSRGLDVVWLCPSCAAVLSQALDTIEGVFGEKTGNIAFTMQWAKRKTLRNARRL